MTARWLMVILVAPGFGQSLDGVWRSQGYGTEYEIHASGLKSFEVTTTTCVGGFAAKRLPARDTSAQIAFQSRDSSLFFIGPGASPDNKVLLRPDGLSGIYIDRVAALSPACTPFTPNTPQGNLEVFARTFAEQYISFDLRQIDWDTVVAENRTRVNANTTPAQLFDILAGMIRPLTDIHTYLESHNPKREFDAPLRPGTNRLVKGGIDRFAKRGRRELFAVTDRAYLRGPLQRLCNGQVWYGHVADGIAYLRFLQFGDYSRRGGLRGSIAALDLALDEVLSDPMLRGVIIEVRLSFGGDDQIGVAVASRLTGRKYLAYSIQARSDPAKSDQWTPAQPVIVQPSLRRRFLGPVVALIGPITMSGAETFIQALMGREPHVELIGENTQGVFCDVLDRRLPNGWQFGLPNAVYRTANGTAFDARGIPPEIAAPVFTDADVAAGRDPAMAAALSVLGRH
jgi:hypothetical protein